MKAFIFDLDGVIVFTDKWKLFWRDMRDQLFLRRKKQN